MVDDIVYSPNKYRETEGTKVYRGKQKAAEILKKVFRNLKNNGIGVIAIAHTKTKKITPKGCLQDGGFDVFTSTLESVYEAVFADIFDVVLTGYIEREIVDGKMQSSARYLCFRGDGFIEAGGRFAFGTVPDKIPFNKANMAKDVIEVIETGMKESRRKKISEEQFIKEQQEERKRLAQLSTSLEETQPVDNEPEEESQEKVEEVDELNQQLENEEESTELFDMGLEEEDEVDVEKNKQLLKEIQSKFKACTKDQKEKIKELLKENNANKFNVEVLPTRVFEETLEILG